MSTVAGALQNIGAVSGIIGIFWLMWDKYATGPGWWIIGGLVALLIGSALI